MNHKEFKRILPDADSAFLFIHGILGTPDQFDNLIHWFPLPCRYIIYSWMVTARGQKILVRLP